MGGLVRSQKKQGTAGLGARHRARRDSTQGAAETDGCVMRLMPCLVQGVEIGIVVSVCVSLLLVIYKVRWARRWSMGKANLRGN